MSTTSQPDAAGFKYPSTPYAWYVVFVLIVAYTVSYVDRTMLTLMVKPIRATLHITDLQLSLLHGLAFAIFYTFLGIPIARYADRLNRRNIIIGGVLVWSTMTACCGLARNFGQMFAARVGVGMGEATLSPCAYSMLADYFPPKRLTRALSVYTAAIYVGSGLALIGGGAVIGLVPAMNIPFIGHMEPWQVVFLIIAAPGILVSLLFLTVREPVRQGIAHTLASRSAVPIRTVIAYVRARGAAYWWLIAGFSAASLMWNGVQGWVPSFFNRTYGWQPSHVGLVYGSVMLVLGPVGIIFGGWFAAWMRGRGDMLSNLKIGLISSALALPFGVLAPLMPTAVGALSVYCFFIFFATFPYGAAAASLQEITPNQMRAQVSSLYLFGLNLAGIGVGPTVVAFITDKVFHNDLAVRYSLSIVVALAAPVSIFCLYKALKPYGRALQQNEF